MSSKSSKLPSLRSIAFLGIVGLFAAYHFGSWMYASQQLDQMQASVQDHFKYITPYEDKTPIPSMVVQSPVGQDYDLRDAEGRYTVLNVWATWCTPCIEELPALQKLQDKFKTNPHWRVLAVSIDSERDAHKVKQFTKQHKVERVAGFHDIERELQKALNPVRLPTTFILTPSGRIVYEVQGDADWAHDDVVQFLLDIPKVY